MGRFRESFEQPRLIVSIARIAVSVSLSSAALCPAGQAYTIEGKVEHVEQLPAVEQKFTPGVQFDQSMELSPNNIWVKIPKWIAGSWSAREETAVFYQDFGSGVTRKRQETFTAKQDFTYGQQADKSGQIWHYLGVPYTSKTARSTAEEVHEVKEKRLVSASDEQVEFRSVATVLLVDNLNSQIQRTYQQESLTTYQPISDDRISMSASTKVFNAGGKAQTLQKNEAIIKRYKHFRTVNEKDGKDLKALFRQYMTAKGMADLLED